MKLEHIPTNIITGFLGAGKTTAILHLLKHKPESEHWAVLVNEFGVIGIDGAMLRESGASVREVPGGCICCVAGVPLQIGLNQLLAQSRPDRLLIEPSGLGHPKQIIESLTSDGFAQVLDLQATVTLVDPRKLTDERYTSNGNFRDQIAVADLLIASKADLCTEEQLANFASFAEQLPHKPPVETVAQGAVDPRWLNAKRRAQTVHFHHHHHRHAHGTEATLDALPTPSQQERFLRRENSGQGYVSCGWVFHPSIIFDFDKLCRSLKDLDCDRLKAIAITEDGIAVFNKADATLNVYEVDDCSDSRFEVIHAESLDWQHVEAQLIAALA